MDKEIENKPSYEIPTVIELGSLATAFGDCSTGSFATGMMEDCATGSYAGDHCTSGGTPMPMLGMDKCTAGYIAGGSCLTGDYPKIG